MCSNVLLFQDFIPDNTLHDMDLSLHLLTFLLAAKVSQTFFAFDDFVRFKDCWSGIVYKVPPLGFIQGLSHG